MALLEFKNLTYESDGLQILKNVSFSIEKGSVTAFLGSPGSGKSTALKMLAGILIPTKGKNLFDGKDVMEMNRKENLAYRKRCGFMFQNSALWANQDIHHNFLLPLQIHFPKMDDKDRMDRINEVVKMVGYNRPLNIRPASLSIGEQKRVGFGRAIMCEPEVLFLDEPTESLDQDSAIVLTKLVQDFASKGNTVVFVSHDNDFVNSFKCDKYYFENGSIVDKILLNEEEMWSDEEL